MSCTQYDVVVVGAGCAGLTAAIGLARGGFTVAVVEAAPMAGGANGIGGVCFAENLIQPDILGPDGVDALAWERRLIERGSFATDGRRLVGNTYRDPDAFRHCYTILRPIFDHHLAQIALTHGVALLTETTVESLIRDGRRVIGVATTRGPLYGDLVFLAEGDAGHLVSREGLDRSSDPRDAPAFLYCLQQVIDLPPGAIEETFRVGPEQGVAHDLLLRNRGPAALNVRGFVCTNRQSLTLSVVLPAEHLSLHFNGEARQLLDWFADMPALRPWWRDGRRGAWTAQLIRAGGPRDIPYLVEDGLAVGGAVAGLGVDFPVMNSTGPATATGLLLSRAAACIRAKGGGFSREQLQRHYLEPLQQTRYWKDMEFLQRWPGYVKRTRVLFDRQLDLLLDSAAVWTRPRRWLPRKLLGWLGMLSRVRWMQWSELRKDFFHLGHALRLGEVTVRPALGRVLLDGALNAFRDFVRQPRPHLPPRGELRVHFHLESVPQAPLSPVLGGEGLGVRGQIRGKRTPSPQPLSPGVPGERGLRDRLLADEDGTASATPALLRRWFGRFRPVLASAGHILYRNDDMPLSARLTRMVELLVRQINLLDLLAVAGLGALTILASVIRAVGGYPFRRLCRPPVEAAAGDMAATSAAASHREEEDRRLSQSTTSEPRPHIHIVSKSTQPRQRAEAVRSLPHICPTGVFELRGAPPETVEVAVHNEKCIQCEACWRTNPFVDWGRGGRTPLPSPLLSPVVTRLLHTEDRAGLVRPAAPQCVDPWGAHAGDHAPPDVNAWPRVFRLLAQLDRKLHEFDRALDDGPALVDRGRSDHLEMLARYAQQLALRVREMLQKAAWPDRAVTGRRQILELVAALVTKLEERSRRTWDGRFAWAAADGRQIRQHHLTGLHRWLGKSASGEWRVASGEKEFTRHSPLATRHSSRVDDAAVKHLQADIAARRLLLKTLDPPPTSDEMPAGAELLAALVVEIRDGMASRIAELHILPGDTNTSRPKDRPFVDETYRRHGPGLLGDTEGIRALLDLPGDWTTIAQRRALSAEREEIQEAEQRLVALASDWRNGSPEPAVAADVSPGFARQAAHVLAGKMLLLRIHARLEEGSDAQLALVLLRVWLDYTATLWDEFTILVQDRLRPPAPAADRPLVEPGVGSPLRTHTEYLAAAAPYTTGDFLLSPVDLLQPRLIPEMLSDEDEVAIVEQAACLSANPADKQAACSTMDEGAAQLLHLLDDMRDRSPGPSRREEAVYVAEALALEMIGRRAHAPTQALDLEMAGARLILADLQQRGGALRERGVILQALAGEVMPRWLRGGVETGVRHLGRDVLELEALKADLRRRLLAAWEVFGEALGRNADVQASCFALAEAVAWLKAADSVLGRMAWLSRLTQVEERDEPAAQQAVGRRALSHCHAEVRDRLHRFDEDLASLRRGYYAPHVRAAALLASPEHEPPATPPSSDIELSLRVLVVVEPLPAVLSASPDGGERVLESHWTLGDADRAALENALRLRDAAPDRVRIDVAALGPPRVGQALREILSLGIEHVHLVVQDREAVTAERAAAMLAAKLESAASFDLILGGDAGAQRGQRFAVLVAGALGLLLAGHAAEATVQASSLKACVRLMSAASAVPRERPLPAAVLIEAGTVLRPFTVEGYLIGLMGAVEIVPV